MGGAVEISYMGSKRDLAPHVRAIVETCPEGPLLDLFAGICFVSREVAPARPVWTNDAQAFASLIGEALFRAQKRPLRPSQYEDIAQPFFAANVQALTQRFKSSLAQEAEVFADKGVRRIKTYESRLASVQTALKLERERKFLALNRSAFPYRLFCLNFPGSYFGLTQCIEIDSIRFAIDRLSSFNEIDDDDRRWMLLALGQAVSRIATTTGHFAQFLSINSNNQKTHIRQRKRVVWDEWLDALSSMAPVGTKKWRQKNKNFNEDAVALLKHLRGECEKPQVIYADPPYTDDQYSRFYHVLETLVKYDYPISTGIGRYRGGRFQSRFSLKSDVSAAFTGLIEGAAALGAHLVLSYPQKGLLTSSLTPLLRRSFAKVEIATRISHRHSSLGASKGFEKHDVSELVYYAR